MKKIFISQPMRGLTDEEIIKQREEGIALAKEIVGEDIEILDSLFEIMPKNSKPLHYLAKSLEYLAEADFALFLGDFKNFRGCKIEFECAKQYGVNILNVEVD